MPAKNRIKKIMSMIKPLPNRIIYYVIFMWVATIICSYIIPFFHDFPDTDLKIIKYFVSLCFNLLADIAMYSVFYKILRFFCAKSSNEKQNNMIMMIFWSIIMFVFFISNVWTGVYSTLILVTLFIVLGVYFVYKLPCGLFLWSILSLYAILCGNVILKSIFLISWGKYMDSMLNIMAGFLYCSVIILGNNFLRKVKTDMEARQAVAHLEVPKEGVE